MKIKLILITLLIIGSCSFRKPIDTFSLKYRNNNVAIRIIVTHKEKMSKLHMYKDPYFYYGELELEILKPDLQKSDIPYVIAVYKNQKSNINYDSLADYGDFWRHLDWSSKIVNKYKVYISFEGENIDTNKIYLKEVNKKFNSLPIDFYDGTVPQI